MEKYYYPYGEFIEDLTTLVKHIDKDFDTIVPIARGGLVISHFLSEHYNIRKVFGINTIGYEGSRKLDNIKIFNIPNLNDSSNVLIVDDIVDSGDTLISVLSKLKDIYPDIIFYTAALFYKKSAKISPTWFVKEPKEWIDFFWSEDLKRNK